jgi:hypothetical protein
MLSFVAASLRGRLENPLWLFQSGIFTAQSCHLSLSAKLQWPYQQALPKAIKGNFVNGKNSQFTANVGNLAA